jgi:trehalose/maltose hydrolase-like predicted phosphorylase
VSALDGAVKNQEAGDDPRVGSAISGPTLHMVDSEQAGGFSALVQKTHNSGFTLVSATESVLNAGLPAVSAQDGQRLTQSWELALSAGQTVTLTKYGSYYSSRDYDAKELMWRSKDTLANAAPQASTICAWRRNSTWPTSGSRPTCRSPAMTRSSKVCTSTSSTCCNRWAATARPISPPRA